MDRDRYPETAAGHRGRDTGIAAAAMQNPTLKPVRELVEGAFAEGPASPEQITERLRRQGHDLWPMTVRCRVSDLGKLGRLVDTGERATSMSGRAKSIIWRLATVEEFAQHLARMAAKAEKEGGQHA
jgi:hypothetical protein